MSSDASYLRCRHCRGFYETSFARCKWCGYDTPVRKADGQPRIYPNRDTCRAVQIAEYEQLPPEAQKDGFGPPPEHPEVRCECLHCGKEGHVFEAVEMRWLANEQMWACPCTTCGGRGFNFDIHPLELRWHCEECHHQFDPPDGRYVHENAVCPRCGSRAVSGWFDDEEFDDEPIDDAEEEDLPLEPEDESEDNLLDDNDLDDDPESGSPGHWIEDDIDHPRPGRSKSDDSGFNPGDIPF